MVEPLQEEAVVRFIHGASIANFPPSVIEQARRCFLDLLTCSLAGAPSKAATIAREFAASFGGSEEAGLFGDSRRAPLPLAILANTAACQALDCDDGFNAVKGHPGAFLFPALLACCEMRPQTGREALEALVIGYEIGIRAGLLMTSLYPTYHGSGAWGGVGTATVLARCFGFDAEQTARVLGAAEYHGTVAPIMRCVSHPAMGKDAAAWGAFSGASAALLARSGFTTSPSLYAFPDASDLVESLGSKFLISGLYFKSYCCCRWAHPAIRAALRLRAQAGCDAEQMSQVEIETFREACTLFQGVPRNSEQAQYSLIYAVAAALVYGDVGPAQVADDRVPDDRVVDMARRITVRFREEFQPEFPLKRLAEVIITIGGQRLKSGIVAAQGDSADDPMPPDELERKFIRYTAGSLSIGEQQSLLDTCQQIEDLPDLSEFARILCRSTSARN